MCIRDRTKKETETVTDNKRKTRSRDDDDLILIALSLSSELGIRSYDVFAWYANYQKCYTFRTQTDFPPRNKLFNFVASPYLYLKKVIIINKCLKRICILRFGFYKTDLFI